MHCRDSLWAFWAGMGTLETYNLLSYFAFGQWVVFVVDFGYFSQSGSGIHSYVLCVGWAFHWQSYGGLFVSFLGVCDRCVACGFRHLLKARDVLGSWAILLQVILQLSASSEQSVGKSS